LKTGSVTEERTSYRQIFKATSLFGGVQVFSIIIAIIRSKFIAVLLGPTGIGIAGLLTSATGLIEGLTSFRLGTSAIKNVSAANATGNTTRIAVIIKVFRRLIWITGILGTILTIILSPWLSRITFGNHNYTIAFIWISITLLFNQLTSGQKVVLQGLHKLKYLAKANITGNLTGLIITVPMYYIWKIDAIVPAIIISSLVSLSFSWIYSHKVKIAPVKVTPLRTFAEGKSMVYMGFMISLTAIISIGAAYILRIYISNTGSVEQVGLYNAGFAIINTYVGLIFTAMTTDYYPRLSAVAHSNELCRQTINRQAEVAILILAPIIIIFLVFINWVVILFYSNKFIAINQMIRWAALGMFFKTICWAIGYLFYSKGSGKLIFWNELIMNLYILGLNILGYKIFGLTGLGISFLVGYLLGLVQTFLLSKIKFSYSFDKGFGKIFIIQFALAISCFIVSKLFPGPWSYLAGIILIIISGVYSLMELEKRMELKNAIIHSYRNYFHKN
jgi:O-antigen/teichoic acid export membrane protein